MQSLSQLFDNVSRSWKIAAVTISLISIGAISAKAVATIAAIPERLEAHDSRLRELTSDGAEWTKGVMTQNKDILAMLTRIHRDQATLLCVKIAELRHTDWGRCLFGKDAVE